MELQSPKELFTAINRPTTNWELCYHFQRASFETVSSAMHYIANAFLNVLLSLLTTVLNTLLLSAVRKHTSLHLPSKFLLGSLVLTDLGVGITVQPMFVAFLVAKVQGCICFTQHCWMHTDLCLLIDHGSNTFRPVHRIYGHTFSVRAHKRRGEWYRFSA